MIKYDTFTQVRGYYQRVIGETPKSTIRFDFCRATKFRQGLLDLLKGSPEIGTISPKGRHFCRKILPWERTFDNLKKFPGGLPRGCWRLELINRK